MAQALVVRRRALERYLWRSEGLVWLALSPTGSRL
jgi:hypothetical protein